MTAEASIFYDSKYLEIQNHPELLIRETDEFKIIFSIAGEKAVSLPQGLFGSFVKKNRTADLGSFQKFWKDTAEDLKSKGVSRVEVVHPPDIYQGFVGTEWLSGIGFSIQYEDINHHIIPKNFSLHDMEKRKLDKLNKNHFSFNRQGPNTLEYVYDFLSECRAEKGLTLNVTKETLISLFETFPKNYNIYTGHIGGNLASVMITLKTTENILYYFLPGTLEKFKSDSPMVGVLHGIVQKSIKDTRYIDLGVSSIQGKPQEGLIAFKERMGGIADVKRRYFQLI